MHHLKCSGAAVLVAVALATTLALVAPDPAAASARGVVATPANVTAHPWSSDGCSASPERGPGWDFHHACIHHDGCYRGHWASRRACDDRFLGDMRASCRVLHRAPGLGRWACDGLAAVYYSAVRAFGGWAYAHHAVYVPLR